MTVTTTDKNGETVEHEDPDFMQVLLNVNKVSIDGEVYSDVIEVELEADTND